jgi:hypothetical protein
MSTPMITTNVWHSSTFMVIEEWVKWKANMRLRREERLHS